MFFPAAKVIIRDAHDPHRILLVKRTFANGTVFYEPAGGRLEVDVVNQRAESLEECARREVLEEMGLHIQLERYVGSYYFFWSKDPTKGCSCAVFVGTIASSETTFTGNPDTTEEPLEPVWVTRDEIVSKAVPLPPVLVGLESVILDYFDSALPQNPPTAHHASLSHPMIS
jgi:NADH pyrophosphatase NudC (nudix superfamily)